MTQPESSLKPTLLPWLLELFIAGNLGFLAVDVYVAHATNSFGNWIEWIPIGFSLAAPLFLLPAWVKKDGYATPAGKWLGFVVGVVSMAVGLAGMIFHLMDTFFVEQTLKSLIFTAPFVAPLAYTGLGLLLLLNRMEPATRDEWGSWVILLALGGFLGNFILALADHAQNGFFVKSEWIAVFSAALAIGFLSVAGFLKQQTTGFLKMCGLCMALQILVGCVGFGFHLFANLHAPGASLWSKFVFGAPVFAPLLFADLALLAALGLYQRNQVATS